MTTNYPIVLAGLLIASSCLNILASQRLLENGYSRWSFVLWMWGWLGVMIGAFTSLILWLASKGVQS